MNSRLTIVFLIVVLFPAISFAGLKKLEKKDCDALLDELRAGSSLTSVDLGNVGEGRLKQINQHVVARLIVKSDKESDTGVLGRMFTYLMDNRKMIPINAVNTAVGESMVSGHMHREYIEGELKRIMEAPLPEGGSDVSSSSSESRFGFRG